jgi:hypothetical protein
MATSIQTVGNRTEIFNDLDLLAVLALLNEAATQRREECPSLEPFVKRWHENCVGYGPGTLDLGLEEVVANNAARKTLDQLLLVVERRLCGLGRTVPASLLAAWCKAPGIAFKDYPAEHVRSAMTRIRALLT